MCTTIHFRSRSCGHHWLQIAQPCWPGQGFSTCSTFGDGCARDPSPELAHDGLCPACSSSPSSSSSCCCSCCSCCSSGGGAPGVGYNMHYVRMITEIRDRVRCGEGPCKADAGVDCIVM